MTSKNTVLSWTENPRVISSILILGTNESACEVETVVKELYTLEDIRTVFGEDIVQPKEPELHALKQSKRRVKAPPAPEGGITLCQAERKYGIDHNTIRHWARREPPLVPILLETRNCVYLDDKALAKLVKKYLAFPGRGRRTALQTA
jgi:hypothetical protein